MNLTKIFPILTFRVWMTALLLFLQMIFINHLFSQSAGFNSTYAILSINGGANAYYDLQATTSNPDFNGSNLGLFYTGTNTLTLKGAEHNVYKCGSSDLTSTRLMYRIYPTSGTGGSFTSINVNWASGFNNGCGGQDQQWSLTNNNLDVLAGLSAGSYFLEVYSEATVTNCCGGTVYAGNNGANYKASFTIAPMSLTSAGVAVVENFDNIGSSATAALPSGFKFGQNVSFANGVLATTLAAGSTGTGVLTGSSGGAYYNFANGITASSTDRSVGFLSTGSFTSPRDLMLQIQNNTGSSVSQLQISFDYEKYRSGTRAFNLNFFQSLDGVSWTPVISGDESFAADAGNTTIFNPPTSISKNVNITGLNVQNGNFIYLKWTYTGVGGSSNGQAIGIDNVSVTAINPSFNVTYDGNSNTGGTAPTDATNYSSGSTVTVLGNTGSLARTGYTFDGWNTLANGSGTDRPAGSTFSISANTTLFAKWAANSNTITFDGNGATSGATASQNISTAASANLTANGFIRAGYSFTGWNSTSDGTGTSYADQSSYTMGTSNVTLYAQWTANNLTVTFDSQGGSSIPNGSTVTGGSVSNPGNPTQSGYSFNGWFVSASGGIAVSFPYSHGETSDFTLFAQWTAASVPIIDQVALTSPLTNVYGTASSAVSFQAAGSNLTENILASAEAGYEVSLDNIAYSNTVTVSPGTTIYLRNAATKGAGTYNSMNAVLLSSSGASSQYVSSSSSGNIVSTKEITVSGITISNKIYDGNTTATVGGSSAYSGLENGESFAVVGTPVASFDNKNVGVAKPISIVGFLSPSSNYSTTQPSNLTADISPLLINVENPQVNSKIYDGNLSATITASLNGAVAGDVVTFIGTGTFASPNAGTNIPVTSNATLGGSDGGNYTIQQPLGLQGNITAKSLSISANNVTKAIGQVITGGAGSTAFTSTGLVVPETIGSVTISYGSASAATGDGAVVGTYPNQVTPSNAVGGSFDANNYSITYVDGSIIVSGFTPGNLLVERIGNGTTSLSGSASEINILELTSTGSNVQTIVNQFTGVNLLTEGGSTTSNGYFNSYDLRVGFTGQNTPIGTASASSLNLKAVNVLDAGAYVVKRVELPTGGPLATPPSPFSGSNMRSVIPITDSTFYVSGTSTQQTGNPVTGGLWYYNGNSFNQINNSTTGFPTNFRNVEIFNGQLYFSSATGNFLGISKIGNGLPTSSNEIPESVIFMGAGASPYGFSFSPDNKICYISDDRASVVGGVQKWVKTGETWNLAYILGSGATNIGARGLTVDYSGEFPVIYATTAESSSNRLIKIIDNGAQAAATTIATAGTNFIFRGVDFSPALTPSAPVISSVVQPNCSSTTGSVILSGLPAEQWSIYGHPNGSITGSGSTVQIDNLPYGQYQFSVTTINGRTSTQSASVTINNTTPTNLLCWETATCNQATGQWEITGTQAPQPATACYQTATFNTTTCQWDVAGTQAPQPTATNCWDN
ncbi:MAG: InlB B-repeat-containing protein, partial [Bacteroidetes bacterium]|nr:InlB B-repeat-containing protein [Bacteroidota bacterium]